MRSKSATRARGYFWSIVGSGLLLVSGTAVVWSLRGQAPTPQTMLEACWVMMRQIWGLSSRQDGVLAPAVIPLLIFGMSSLWATWRLLWAWGRTRRLLACSEPYRPGHWSALDAALRGLPWHPRQLRLLATSYPLACTLGVWQPRLLLSTGLVQMLSAAEMRAMLGHEWGHMRRRDALRLAVLRWWSEALWFLPLVRTLAEECKRAIEEAADDAAVELTEAPLELAAALVKTAKARVVPSWSPAPALAGELALTERIERLLALAPTQPRRSRHWQWAVSLAVGVGLLVLLFTPTRPDVPVTPLWSALPPMTCQMPLN